MFKVIMIMVCLSLCLTGCAFLNMLGTEEGKKDFLALVQESIELGDQLTAINEKVKEIKENTDKGLFSVEAGTKLLSVALQEQAELLNRKSEIEKKMENLGEIPWWQKLLTVVGGVALPFIGVYIPKYAGAVNTARDLIGHIESADSKEVKKLVEASKDPKIHKILKDMRLIS